MALATVGGIIEIPPFPPMSNLEPHSFRSYAVDAAGEAIGWVFCPPENGNIRKVGFYVNAINTDQPMDIRLETVSTTTGMPTGTLFHANAVATNRTLTAGFNWIAFDSANDIAVTTENLIAIVVQWTSTNGDIDFFAQTQIGTSNDAVFPYTVHDSGAGWADASLGYPPNFGVIYDDDLVKHIPGATAHSGGTRYTVDDASTPDRIGAKFKLPFAYRIVGFRAFGRIDNGEVEAILYGSNGTTEERTWQGFDDDALDNGTGIIGGKFQTPFEASADTWYRIVLHATHAALTCRLYLNDVTDDSTTKAIDSEPMGQNFISTNASGDPTTDGDWDDDDTEVAFISILIDQIDYGGGAASGARNPLVGPIS